MRVIVFILTLTITSNLFAGEKDTVSSPHVNKIQIGLNFSPDYCYKYFVGGSPTGVWVPKFGYTGGLNAIYNLKESLALEIGLQFSNKGYQTSIQNLTYGSQIDPRNGFVYSASSSSPIKAKFIYNYYYLDFPLRLNFSFGHDSNIKLISSLGFATNILIQETTKSMFEYSNGKKEEETYTASYPYNKINVSTLLSFGGNWKLNRRTTLRIERIIRYALAEEHLWNAGLNLSIFRTL